MNEAMWGGMKNLSYVPRDLYEFKSDNTFLAIFSSENTQPDLLEV